MGGNIIPLIIFIIFVVLSIAGSVKKASQQQGRAKPRARREDSEPPDEAIQQFLGELQRKAEAAPQQPPQMAQAGPVAQVQPPQMAQAGPVAQVQPPQLPPAPQVVPIQVVEEAQPAVAVRAPVPEQPVVPQRPRAAQKRRPRKPRRAPASKPAPAAAAGAPKPAPQARVPFGARPTRWDLKRAVVWSEILGAPISMRRHIGHRPPTLRT